MHQFRDPIHGFIEISTSEKKIIDSPPFQRLRNIRQLATTYLVYHGAEHTRFGHSLGVMHLVTKTFDSVVRKNDLLFRSDKAENDIVTLWYRQILRLIALTHDLGHAPFSHASESVFGKGFEHEDFTRKIILETEIANHISEIGSQFQSEYGIQYKITPALICMIYEGKDVLHPDFIMPDFKFLQSFMDSELDCDKMDYLLRDSHFCGVSYGKYDLERFISTLTVYKKANEKIIHLAIEKGGIQAFEEFVLARYFMFIQVYFHKTRRLFDKKLIECLKKILPNGKYPSDINDYLSWDDNKVLNFISAGDQEVYSDYRNRVTMACVYETRVHANSMADENIFKMLCYSLSKKFGKENFIFDDFDKKAHKLTPVFWGHADDSGYGISVIDKNSPEPSNIMDESLILKGILEPIHIKRIYAQKDICIAAKLFIDELKGDV